VITLGGGFFYPVGVAVDSSGFVYVIDHTPTTSSLVKEMVNTCTSSSCVGTLGGGFAGLQGVAVDGSGNVYVSVSNSNNNEVIEVVRHGVSFPSTNVGSSTTATVTFTIWSGGAIGTPAVVTQGSSGRDFTDTGTGTCTTTNGAGNSYSADATCTVDVTFAPKFAGTRYGAVELTDTSGAVIATAYVYGTGKGPQVVFNAPLTPATLGGGFNSPSGTAMDGSGNVYVADAFNHAVKEIPAGCALSGCVITVGGGFGQPQGVAVDGSGNIFVADPGNNAVYEMASTCRSSGCVSSLGGGFYNPSGVAVDSNRNVYVADSSNRVVKVMSSLCTSPGCVSMLGGGFSQFYGVAVDGSGNVYVADTNYNAVRKMANTCTSSSCVTTLGGGFNTPQGIAVDGNGNVYVADAGNNAVKVMANTCTSTLYASSSCTVTTLGSGYSYPAGVAVDGSGNVYVANTGNNAVKELNRAAPALNFATTAVGAASSDSPKTLVLQNIGNSALTFLAPASGGNPSISTGFSIGNASTCPQLTPSSSAGTLASGASCTDVISFTPVAKGNDSGSVEITDNTLNVSPSTQTISLSGTATAGSKTINFTQPASPVYAGTGATLVATASNGDAVTFSVTNGTGTATVIGSTISYLTPGTVTVHADSAVTSNYNAAPTVSYSVTIQIGPLVFLAGSGKVASLSSSGGVTSSGVAGGGIGAAVDQNGLVFSITADGTGISTFNPDGTLANTSSGVLTGASALAIDGTDQLWIAFPGGLSTAQILGAGTGSVTDSTLQKPGGVAIDVSGNVWVSDSQSNTVHEIIGGAAPAEPLANAVQSATPGTEP
jgi:sugar lactone lactonase YvrE